MSENTTIVVARRIWDADNSELQLSGLSNVPAEHRVEAVREATIKALLVSDRLGLVQGELLYEVHKQKYWSDWGFESFEDYVEKELQFRRRKAYYLVQIYSKFVVELGLSIEVLKGLEWAKAKELTKVLTKENALEILEKIKKMSVSDVIALRRDLLKKSRLVNEEEFKSLNFKLTVPQYENVKEAFKTAFGMTGSKKEGHLLDLICTDFLVGRVESDGAEAVVAKIDKYLRALERTFGVVCEVKEIKHEVVPSFDAD